ncbi:glutamine--fructose-6-phosphate transaminase (isomerizing) [Nocardia bovistercoris]|uniref:Glutamine--fructose-6-phosphate aminotransferase [isomerizing] n=1 Tax=Nocardia bovistercoris TaxID=2785916 RepID=A0A931IBY8_9NOCA|nr:glutamine--fructose-6-phosphate transaminase (isomerizing) [Nocardia bovistercoris]MBH0777703.1 glutamine--fructose-6-phosphate transaminase (isomerizing) [Nocardia bovistercoris]
MCGIVGMTSPENIVTGQTADQLSVLEYRGYDSWGLACLTEDTLAVVKDTGSIGKALREGRLSGLPDASLALGHTRWATHGGVTAANAHPHLSYDRAVAVVHNGVIENHQQLRRDLEASGVTFASDTDSEVAAHLIARHLEHGASMRDAIAATTATLSGEYALAVISVTEPATVWGAKHKSPLVVAFDGQRGILASDQMALDGISNDVLFLDDGDIVAVRADSAEVYAAVHGSVQPVTRAFTRLTGRQERADKGQYPHWMIKEIHETPTAVTAASSLPAERFASVLPPDRAVTLIGAGSAFYVASMGQYLLKSLAGIRASALPSDEAEYLAVLGPGDPLIAVSQSGETFDTLEICRTALAAGAVLTSICNVPSSTQERLATHRLPQGSGPEICVLSTKSIVSQVVLLARLALETGRANRTLSAERYAAHQESLERLPDTLTEFIATASTSVQALAAKYSHVGDWFFLGRGILYPAACESALKFKEVNYHHAEGMASGFFKHGTISLIDEHFYTVALLPSHTDDPDRYAATLAAVSEIAARKGPVIGIGPADLPADDLNTFVEYLPLPYHGDEIADLIIQLVAGQLLAYYCALDLGREIDQPRSLAKSVTVR